MGAVSEKELLKKWKLAECTADMAIGQLIQHIITLHQTDGDAAKTLRQLTKALTALKSNISSLRHDVDALIAHTKLPPHKQNARGSKEIKTNP